MLFVCHRSMLVQLCILQQLSILQLHLSLAVAQPLLTVPRDLEISLLASHQKMLLIPTELAHLLFEF